jgi:hypothetical protein
LVITFRGIEEILILIGPRLIILIESGKSRVMEDIGEPTCLTMEFQTQLAILFFESALVLVLILPGGGVACAWLRLYIVPPHVFGTLPVSPDILASNATSVATNALVQVENH